MIPSLTLCAMQGIITAPILYAIEEFPQLRSVVDKGFDELSNVDVVSEPFYRCNWAAYLPIWSTKWMLYPNQG